MKIAVVGSRDFENYELVKSVLDLATKHGVLDEVVSGGARGADFLGKKYAIENNVPYKEFPAQWDIYGRGAGMIRNKLIVEYCDMLIAFWDGTSKGTKNAINLARKSGKRVFII